MYKITSILVALFLVFAGKTQNLASGYLSPELVVSHFQSLLISNMKKAAGNTIQERYDFLSPRVESIFHFPLMTQIIIGNYWKTANKNQKLQLKTAFLRMSVSILATLFDDYDGEQFSYTKTKDGPSKTKLVLTNLIKSDKSKITLIYVTRNFEGGWRIIDLIVDGGISELKIRQSEYRQTLKNTGVPGLIKLLNKKSASLLSGKI